MSDKPRRDITLGEMQDECGKHKKCQVECPFESFCTEQRTLKDPSKWNLDDPPRFNEAQMALLNGLWEIGARKLTTYNVFDTAYYILTESGNAIGTILITVFGKAESPLDLAELLGKDATHAQA